MEIFLIRHGETDWNQIHRFQGREDIPLNPAGVLQAQSCGRALKNVGISAIYTSPLMRAKKTGDEIALQIGLPLEKVFTMQELIERDLGSYSGQIVKDRSEYFAVASGTKASDMEPFDHVLERMKHALVLLSRTGSERVAAVSHGAAINVLLAGLSGYKIGTGKTKLLNGGISIIEGSETEGFRVECCNKAPEDFASYYEKS